MNQPVVQRHTLTTDTFLFHVIKKNFGLQNVFLSDLSVEWPGQASLERYVENSYISHTRITSQKN